MSATSGPGSLDFRPSMRQTMVITEKSMETDGKISRVEVDLEAGQSGPPAHIHPNQREIYTVDHGELTVTLGDVSKVVPAGRSVEVPLGATHTYANRSDEPVRFSAEHEPALDFEEYIRLVHRTIAGRKISLPLVMRIVRIESSYGDTILPAPGIPRIANKVLAAAGKMAGYPTGTQLTAR